MNCTKIAIISGSAFALVQFRPTLMHRLVESGVEVFALAPDHTPQSKAAVSDLGAVPVDFSMSRTGMNAVHDIYAMFSILRALRRVKADVVLSTTIKPSIYGSLAAWLAGVPRRFVLLEGLGYAFTDIGRPSLKKGVLRNLAVVLMRGAYLAANRIFVLNRDDENEVSSSLAPASKVESLGPIGLNLEDWPASPALREPLIFTFVGRLLEEKGIHDFIAAARTVKTAHPDVQFRVIGAPDANPSGIREETVRAWTKEGLITWVASGEMRKELAHTSVFVLPSYREGYSRSMQEAMAMARPVITTDVPGCREAVAEGISGFILPVRDPAALAQAMIRFVSDSSLVETMGLEGRRIAEANFDEQVFITRLLTSIFRTPPDSANHKASR